MWVLLTPPLFRGAQHANGHDHRIDIAKSVFQVHGVDAAGQVVIRRRLKRRHVLMFFQKVPPQWSNSSGATPLSGGADIGRDRRPSDGQGMTHLRPGHSRRSVLTLSRRRFISAKLVFSEELASSVYAAFTVAKMQL